MSGFLMPHRDSAVDLSAELVDDSEAQNVDSSGHIDVDENGVVTKANLAGKDTSIRRHGATTFQW